MFDQYMERLISSRMEKVDGQPQASASYSSTQPLSQQAPDLAPVLGTARNYGMPAVTALPNQLRKKNILWTPITSAGVPLPLPLDTCCSLSLVSQAHADIICQKYPAIQFTKLVTPLPVAVATPDPQLMAIGMLQVPIVWETGKLCTFSMLVVPKLVWPILFGQNHLDMIGAQTDHTKRTVKFTDPDLNFTVSCPNENSVDMYPRLGNPCSIFPNSAKSNATVTTPVCLLTSIPTPSQPSAPIRLHRGFNLVTLCLVMTASLVGSSMFSTPLWLEGNEVCPGVQVVRGPIFQTCISSQPVIPEPPQALNQNYPKCRPSHMLPEPEEPPHPNRVLISQTPSELSDLELPDFSTVLVLQSWYDPPKTQPFYLTMLKWGPLGLKHQMMRPHLLKLLRPQLTN